MQKSICFITYDFTVIGGLNRVLASLANVLSTDYKVYVLSLYEFNNTTSYQLNNNIKYHVIFNKYDRYRNLLVNNFKSIREFFKQHKIDIVLLEGTYTIPFVLTVKSHTKSKWVFCDHGALINQLDDKYTTFLRWLSTRFMDKIVTLTKTSRLDYIRIFKVNKKKVDYIYNWVDNDIFQYVKPYNLYSNKLLSIGRFEKEKGFDLLVDVAELIFKKYPEWEWHIWGNGVEFKAIQNKINDKGLTDNVILKGTTKKIYQQYNEYSMYILTSYREGLPLVLLESKANKLPIVSFDCPTGPSEIIENGQNGYLIKPGNIYEMADKICELIDLPENRLALSNQSYIGLEKFSFNKIIQCWYKLIKSL